MVAQVSHFLKYIMCVCVFYMLFIYLDLPSGSVVKNVPAMQEMQAGELDSHILGREDPLRQGNGTHSSILVFL